MKICDDPSLSDADKDIKKTALINSLKIPTDRYCCKMRLMTYRDLTMIVR
jgi:hypothetical protein